VDHKRKCNRDGPKRKRKIIISSIGYEFSKKYEDLEMKKISESRSMKTGK